VTLFLYVICHTAIGYIYSADVSKCYSVNNETYCFYTNGSLLSWDEAREFCETKNLTLPIITDENIDNVFQQFIVNDVYNVIQHISVWLDAHGRHVNDSVRWHWINEQPSGTDNTMVKSTSSVARKGYGCMFPVRGGKKFSRYSGSSIVMHKYMTHSVEIMLQTEI